MTHDDVTQANFNIDRLDGTGPSGMTLNPQLGNVYQIQFQWLGYGVLIFSVTNPVSGQSSKFHIYEYPNSAEVPSVAQPDM